MDKEILITGGKGFIGSHLRKIFPLSDIYDLKDGQDILNYSQLQQALKGKRIIIHFAALISVTESLQYPGKYYSFNVAGTDNVIRAAIENGCETVIFASSAAVYSPDNPYGLSKKIGEELMKEYKNRIQTVSLRFFNVYGYGQNAEYAGVISKFLEAVKTKKPLVVTGDGTQTRDFISVTDITNVIQKILEKRKQIASGSIFEVGTGGSITIKELANLFAKQYGLSIDYQKNASIGLFASKANNTSLLNAIGNYFFASLESQIPVLVEAK